MATKLYFSVGTSREGGTGGSAVDLSTGNPTVSISGGVMTFSVAQTGNIGIGDAVHYDLVSPKVVYITEKISSTQWRVIKDDGTTPADVTDESLDYIVRVFTTLADALDGSDSGVFQKIGNTGDLVTEDYQINIVCYDDEGNGGYGYDNSFTEIDKDSWTTDSSHYIKVFTPTNTNTECNINNRHDGKHNSYGYTIKLDGSSGSPSTSDANILFGPDYTVIEGIRGIGSGYNNSYNSIFRNYKKGNFCLIDKCLAYADYQSLSNGECIEIQMSYDSVGEVFEGHTSVKNCFVSSEYAGSGQPKSGIKFSCAYLHELSEDVFLYNNTVVGFFKNGVNTGAILLGCVGSSSPNYFFIKNNYAHNRNNSSSGVSDFYFFNPSIFDNSHSNFDYNASNDTTAGTSNNNQQIILSNANFNNTSYSNIDLHIQEDSDLIDQGTGPSSDSNVPTTDIDGDVRSGSICAIGADEYIFISPYSWNVIMP